MQFGEFKTGAEAWTRRVASGQTGEFMMNRLAGQLGGVPFKYFGDWTDRVAKGELPKNKPQRPQGVERNIVAVVGVGHREAVYPRPDLLDRRHPTVNAYGPLYGSPEYSSDDMPILDPKTHKATFFKMPVADPNAPESFGPPFHASAVAKPTQPSAYWGDEKIWSQRANNHNGMFDKQAGCGPRPCVGSKIQLSAKRDRPSLGQGVPARPLRAPSVDARSQDDEVQLHRHLLRDLPSAVRLRRRRHALALGYRPGRRLGQHQDVGRDRRRRQGAGLGPFVLDTNGNGKVDEWAEPDQPADAGKDKRIAGSSLRRDAAPDRRLGLVHPQRVRRHAGVPALRSEDQAQ